jgi:hypothetical protein
MRDTWIEFHREIEKVVDAGENQVVVFFRLRGTARASGVPVDEQVKTIFELKGGRLYRMVVFRDRDEALKAAGLGSRLARVSVRCSSRAKRKRPALLYQPVTTSVVIGIARASAWRTTERDSAR